MSDAPEVSVLVPTFNQERYLGRCLRSLMAQSLERDRFEIIVIDDGSTDGTALVVQSFIEEVRLLRFDQNRGLPAALNAGLEAASGEFSIRVDSDDYVNADFLKVLHLFVAENPDIDAIACDYLLVDDVENVIQRCNALDEPIACGIMFRTEHLHALGRYDESFRIHEDVDLRHRFLERHEIHRLALPLYRYRRHDANMTNDVEAGSAFLERFREKHGIGGGDG
jgi:glycosyltransferase involved in cell wall biosynthesis